ncbi:Zinc finger CCCH domain containing protein 6 [Dissostichus eleginoides]|uniref:Zinc finger CCCH domain containing protein 6 n=1 Tax=Dissostichus eleginoides TaxID=100907 RepID=A0AAD9F2F4_DISEL|nr:Zinc finger CCCH domain containing protein 6 [Dissostichus eleginoides]
MAFANLFSRLSAVEEDDRSPAQQHFTHRNEPENGKRGNARKRKPQSEQTGPNKKKQFHQAQTTRGNNASSFRDGGVKAIGGGHQSRPAWGRGRGDRKYNNNKQEVQVQRPRFMSEEFKDQNAMLVNGRLVCRHFLSGKCIKAAAQSFPCKFFHRRGYCSNGADCKFSHEPLNDITTKLLDEALQKEKDLFELTTKSEQESWRPPENTDESEMIEANKTPDIPLQPLRPVFYNSAEANTEKETTLCATEATDEAAVPPRAPEDAQHQPPQSSNLNPEEPVCYSVEAVLGPQLFKPFPRLFTTPGCEEFGTSGSANPKEVPYSVDAVLRSFKSTLPIVKTVSYTPKTEGDEIAYPLLSSETPNKKVLYSENTRNEVNKSEMFKSLKVHTGLVSKTNPSLTPAYRDYTKQSDCRQGSLKPAPRTAHEVKLGLLHTSVTVAKKSSENKDPTKQKLVPVRGVVSDSTHAHQPDISSHKGSAVASTANSVLKNLFLSLSPYQQDAEQQVCC